MARLTVKQVKAELDQLRAEFNGARDVVLAYLMGGSVHLPPPENLPPPPAPPAERPAPSKELVERVKANLEAAGEDLSGPCGAFKILNAVALVLGPRYGLLRKTAGNRAIPTDDGGCLTEHESQEFGFATDYLIDSDTFYGYDILEDGGGKNGPQWGAPETVFVERNRANFTPAIDRRKGERSRRWAN